MIYAERYVKLGMAFKVQQPQRGTSAVGARKAESGCTVCVSIRSIIWKSAKERESELHM